MPTPRNGPSMPFTMSRGWGKFSTDVSIRNYAKLWGLKLCPPDDEIIAEVRQQYSEHDKCRIY